MPPSIRIIGSLNVDLVSVTPRFPSPGETLKSTSFNTHAGGKGANQAVACGRLSRPRPHHPNSNHQISPTNANANTPTAIHIEMFGATGSLDTYFTSLLQPILQSSGVDTSCIRTVPNDHTGVAVIIVDSSAGGENRILYSPGANYSGMQCTGEVLGMALAAPMPDVMVLQAEIPVETVVGILRGVWGWKEKERGEVEVVFNPAPAPEGGLPVDVYRAVDHLVMNETECESMAPVEMVRGEGGEEGTVATSAARRDKIARYFHGVGVRRVLVTLGAQGVWYSAGDIGGAVQTEGAEWVRAVGEVPAAKVERVVDTTGAGDTFVGGYAVQIARWREVKGGGRVGAMTVQERREWYGDVTERAVRWATKASARCVERDGAMSSIPWEDEIL
ncbi:uncharacterized protein PADG_11977 [Paracoccidioides brasiliensis Pb18]|uniref:Ribokinase n=1 Tax=Paracoccidioides brasiliensis (strain Pb18) TaxID=502780 RepID=A0A0A0HWR8_PARBD|nr:uncharacterized protein PADG_11977 [Paracoccidioides brasiliensis Pb18]KGM91840.1 hypothetical protein PADG_11977 [Paracoccidioides brasiliensis Pb18]ODH52867.1 hypothetical protein GX48_01061 [Paracoccidioides brasiliensis]